LPKILLLGLVLVLSLGTVVSARGGRDINGPGPGRRQGWKKHSGLAERERRFQAKKVLGETTNQLSRAQNVARRGHYRYGLGKAYAHQEQARELYYHGQYDRAMAHSMRARELAVDIITCNHRQRYEHPGQPPMHSVKLADDLDNELTIKVVDDKVALRLHFTLD
jgi:hypothetical protein